MVEGEHDVVGTGCGGDRSGGVHCLCHGRCMNGAVVRSISCNAPLKALRLLGMNALNGSLFHCPTVQGKKLYL